MNIVRDKTAMMALALLLLGNFCTAAIIPFMAVYIVDGLGKDPWMISLYSIVTLSCTLLVNRQFGERIDGGAKIASLAVVAIVCYALANIAILLFQNYWVLLFFVSICFSFSSGANSTMYSFGRLYAERQDLDITRYNSYLRAMTSVGWMLGPATAFLIAGQFGNLAVFQFALGMSVLWFLLWLVAMPKDFRSAATSLKKSDKKVDAHNNTALWLAVSVCFFFAIAHVLCTSALPLFYLEEVGLPKFAPGLSFSVKTFMELGGIFAGPWLLQRWGARTILAGAALIAVVAFVTLAQVTSIPQLVVGAALEGLYYGIFAGISMTFVQAYAGGRMARATSLYMNSLFMGAILAGPSMGIIAQFWSFQTSILLASVGAVCALIALFFSQKQAASAY